MQMGGEVGCGAVSEFGFPGIMAKLEVQSFLLIATNLDLGLQTALR